MCVHCICNPSNRCTNISVRTKVVNHVTFGLICSHVKISCPTNVQAFLPPKFKADTSSSSIHTKHRSSLAHLSAQISEHPSLVLIVQTPIRWGCVAFNPFPCHIMSQLDRIYLYLYCNKSILQAV